MFTFHYGVGGASVVLWFVFMIIYVILMNLIAAAELLGIWFTFKKMGMPGWKGLIPFYSTYVLCDKVWEVKYFWRIVVYTAVSVVSMLIGEILLMVRDMFVPIESPAFIILLLVGLAFIIAFIVMLVLAFVVTFKLYCRMARGFGLKTAWAWGMIFVPYIIFPIIGFHKNIAFFQPVKEE